MPKPMRHVGSPETSGISLDLNTFEGIPNAKANASSQDHTAANSNNDFGASDRRCFLRRSPLQLRAQGQMDIAL
jgi:hypothetical protein